ncbi:hypothetical protein OAT84_04275, partial [Gammaproteobacteria bacterium]|nr:hypothetical protein [Gammaproteobacteria bacterium]
TNSILSNRFAEFISELRATSAIQIVNSPKNTPTKTADLKEKGVSSDGGDESVDKALSNTSETPPTKSYPRGRKLFGCSPSNKVGPALDNS